MCWLVSWEAGKQAVCTKCIRPASRILELCEERVEILTATTRAFNKDTKRLTAGRYVWIWCNLALAAYFECADGTRSCKCAVTRGWSWGVIHVQKGYHLRRRRVVCLLRYSYIWIDCVKSSSCLHVYHDWRQRRCPLYKTDLVIRHECDKTFGWQHHNWLVQIIADDSLCLRTLYEPKC